jgi:hypothetical protein
MEGTLTAKGELNLLPAKSEAVTSGDSLIKSLA